MHFFAERDFGVKKCFWRKIIFWSKIIILVKNHYFGQKSLFLSKIIILVKNHYFGQQSLFWSKIIILVKGQIAVVHFGLKKELSYRYTAPPVDGNQNFACFLLDGFFLFTIRGNWNFCCFLLDGNWNFTCFLLHGNWNFCCFLSDRNTKFACFLTDGNERTSRINGAWCNIIDNNSILCPFGSQTLWQIFNSRPCRSRVCHSGHSHSVNCDDINDLWRRFLTGSKLPYEIWPTKWFF